MQEMMSDEMRPIQLLKNALRFTSECCSETIQYDHTVGSCYTPIEGLNDEKASPFFQEAKCTCSKYRAEIW